MRLLRLSTALAAAGLAGLAPAQQALATVPQVRGPIVSYRCPPAPLFCTRTLKPGIVLQHLRAKLRSGTTQDIYKVSWPLGDAHVSLGAEALNPPSGSGLIQLGTISHWASQSGAPGLLAALNGDFFVSDYRNWNDGHPSGMLVQSRHVVAFGSGDSGVGYEPNGRMVMGTPSARPAKLLLPNGRTASIASFDAGGANAGTFHVDQVLVKTIAGTGTQPSIPTGFTGYVVGSAQAPNPFPNMLRGSQTDVNSSGAHTRETVAGFRFGDGDGAIATDALPIVPAANPVTLSPGQALIAAVTGGLAQKGLTQLATHSGVVHITVDAEAWSHVTDVMGGKPQLVRNGRVQYPTAWQDPPMMSGDGWQWDYPHWRPAVAETKTHGWLVITGGVHYGNGVYGWNWGKMLVQLGAQNAMGFDNNSSTELYAPHNGMWSFSPGWERPITEATALFYH